MRVIEMVCSEDKRYYLSGKKEGEYLELTARWEMNPNYCEAGDTDQVRVSIPKGRFDDFFKTLITTDSYTDKKGRKIKLEKGEDSKTVVEIKDGRTIMRVDFSLAGLVELFCRESAFSH